MNTARKSSGAIPADIVADVGEGFATRPLTAQIARRQLHVSIGVMGIIFAAATALAAVAGVNPAPPEPVVATLTVQQPQFVRPMTAAAPHVEQTRPGG